jgi:S-DNA-T family DNA segregation ATPase FtsK/SpoIIIE
MQQMEREAAFREEILLWIVVAVSLLLFISNLGIGGKVGNAISGFLFGVFGLIAYVFPVILLVGSFFAISNRGNFSATVKVISAVFLALFLCLFCALLAEDSTILKPLEAFQYSREHKIGGGICGGTLAYLLIPAFGKIGSYIIDLIVVLISLILITEKSVMKSMKSHGERFFTSAKESNARYQEYREYRAQERENRRADNKVSGVSSNTKVGDTDNDLPKKEASTAKSDRLKELRPDKADVSAKDDVTDKLEAVSPVAQEPVISPVIEEEKTTDASDRLSVIPMISGNYSRDDRRAESANSGQPAKNVKSYGFMEATKLTGQTGASDDMRALRAPVYHSLPEEPAVEEIVTIDQNPIPAESEPSGGFGLVEEPETVSSQTRHVARPEQETDAALQTAPSRKSKPSAEQIEKGIQEVSEEMEQNSEPVQKYVFPPIDLLKKAPGSKGGNSEHYLRETASKLEQTLKTFGVNVTVTNISCGPAVTQYEVQPEMGVKVSKIVGLADDIKLNLAAADIRIEAPIPGKAAVGIEVPNKENVMVSFRELIEDAEFQKAKSSITFAVGRDIAGKVKVADIGKMPHLLIAGATGSGKSVCINTIIMSILYKADPNDVKLIMIDPKVVELSVYNGIPHLMIPVVTDPKKAAGALNWAVQEMTKRYELFAESGVRDLAGYNAKVDAIKAPDGGDKPQRMPKIVIIVDELADLMMVASGDVEEAICRLAQLARACGIHLVIATQRPSVNVITGLIKANMPSRIAFAVTSGVDSRTILDMVGAEKLLGKGDMLFYPQGIPKPIRVQGAFVSDKEVSDVVEFLKNSNNGHAYNEDVQKQVESLQSSGNQTVSITDSDTSSDGRDSYFYEAAKIIIDKDKASIGMIQRYLKVGFNRAARIMDQMEEAGIVGPEEGTKPRKVLMKQEEFESLYSEQMN